MQGRSIILLFFSPPLDNYTTLFRPASSLGMGEECVVGEFEWIVDFDYLRPFFHSEEMNINHYEDKDLLVIGCGTSSLSYSLLNELQVKSVVSLDNDQNCIQHMKEKYCEYQKMKWLVYDLVENCAQEDRNVTDTEHMKTASYDLVIDKGTLDAVLVEGSIATMLCEIFRVLKSGGVYFLCSLHCPELLEPLFTNSPLEMSVSFLGDCGTEDGRCRTVALCRKGQCNDHFLDLNQMITTENSIMNTFYQELHPLVTNEEKERIHLLFQSKDSLSFQEIHQLVFQGEGALLGFMEYSYDLFIEDVKEFPLSGDQQMTFSEFIEFLSSKQ
jgi:SAM-dependent methyltransferase